MIIVIDIVMILRKMTTIVYQPLQPIYVSAIWPSRLISGESETTYDRQEHDDEGRDVDDDDNHNDDHDDIIYLAHTYHDGYDIIDCVWVDLMMIQI